MQPVDSLPLNTMLSAVREVRIEAAMEQTRAVRDFYDTVFDLRPRRPNSAPGFVGGWIVDSKPRLCFMWRHDPVVFAQRPRVRLLVDSMGELIARLTRLEHPFTLRHEIQLGARVLYLNDPVGHLIEVRQFTAI
ncbi:MAG: hypothetical protein SF069_00790 [Phycisphaerae bacterium]|nr:hypothetical protein [Phycisphaerae bacterium]